MKGIGSMNLLDLSGKTILITSGCGAIGRVVVRVLAEHGAKVIVNDILPEDEAARVLLGGGEQTYAALVLDKRRVCR